MKSFFHVFCCNTHGKAHKKRLRRRQSEKKTIALTAPKSGTPASECRPIGLFQESSLGVDEFLELIERHSLVVDGNGIVNGREELAVAELLNELGAGAAVVE